MKKFIFVLFVALIACTPVKPVPTVAATPTEAKPTATATVLPTSTQLPPTPLPTPTEIPVIHVSTYVVQPGDTLTDIATRFGVTPEYLAGINSIADPNYIYAGQVLKLEGSIEIPPPTIFVGKQIIVKLSAQMVFVYENGVLLRTFIVSTGMTHYETRLGEYQIWIKLPEDHMTGPGYDLPHVPWVMYFDEGRGFHGKTWNHIYGRPSSHGCVNMTVDDSKWLYDWAEVGTDVLVIP